MDVAKKHGLYVIKVSYGEVKHIREVSITDNSIIVKDYANCPFTVGFNNKFFSSQYGKLEKEEKLKVEDRSGDS